MSEASLDRLDRALGNPDAARTLIGQIRSLAERTGPIRIMEVCGSHTVAIRRSGLPGLLAGAVELISGPGCPVCVTPVATIDQACALARLPGVSLATFGDLLRVPGSSTSLDAERAAGADVRIIYSPMDAVQLARAEPDRQVVLLGVGFETTAPTVAAAALAAAEDGVDLWILAAHKLVPPALHALLGRADFSVDGFLLPGHVSAIIGADAYQELVTRHRIPCVVAGFEPLDVLLAVRMLLAQIERGRPAVEVEYTRVVRPAGNPQARRILESVFEPVASQWRGLGSLPASGLGLKSGFAHLDATRRFDVRVEPPKETPGCRCGQVLVGAIRPTDCGLFGRGCTPANPAGPCMVSAEGSCAAHFRYADP